MDFLIIKGQLISKANCQALNSSKKQTNKFVFTSMRSVFVHFLEEIENSKKAFRNCLTFMAMPLSHDDIGEGFHLLLYSQRVNHHIVDIFSPT